MDLIDGLAWYHWIISSSLATDPCIALHLSLDDVHLMINAAHPPQYPLAFQPEPNGNVLTKRG